MDYPIVSIPYGTVPMNGFRWASAPRWPPSGPVCLEPVDYRDVEEQRIRNSRYAADEAVFLEFVACAGDAGSFLTFANSYGPLLSDWGMLGLLDLPNQVETFDRWKTTHGELRRLTAIWSGLLNSNDPTADGAELVREINRHLGDGVRIELRLHPTLGTTLELEPRNLETAIWLRFAEAIAFRRQFQPCKRCTRWMHIPHDGTGRSTRRYCSDTCRLGSYRTRQADAVELAKTGAPIEDIAEKIGSNPDTVRRWIEVGGPNAARRAREQRQREADTP